MQLLYAMVFATGAAGAAAAADQSGMAAADCTNRRFHWSTEEPQINLRHLFCGEIRRGRPKGFHSIRLVATARLVQDVGQHTGEGGGVYSAIVAFTNGARKLSTFFPDHCTLSQIVQSVSYAAANVSGRHRVWGEIGPSAPPRPPQDGDLETFCLDNAGRPFEIRLGVLANGRINTAFPN
ncbi:MAG: EndoU domain-containing protein [Rhodospirillales bacterium]|nr:EndoU domain-containing protein [Rhodospirillales bacterium]